MQQVWAEEAAQGPRVQGRLCGVWENRCGSGPEKEGLPARGAMAGCLRWLSQSCPVVRLG